MVSILPLHLILVEHTCPVRLIILKLLLEVRQFREDFAYCDETWLDDEVYEADLTLGNVCSDAIEELTDGELVLLFQIALLEELHEDEISPELAEVPGLCRVRYVGQVEHETDEQFFVLRFRRVKLLVPHPTVQVAQLGEVLRHVRRQHCLNDHLAHALEVSTRHFLLPVATLVFRHQLE